MNASVSWQGDMTFVGEADTGFSVTMDSSTAGGGHDSGFRPTELIAIGAAGCSSMNVVSILRKKKVSLSGYTVKVEVTSAPEHPRVFTEMVLEYIFTGKSIKREDVERAVQLSKEKYCQSIIMMSKTAKISHKITIIEE